MRKRDEYLLVAVIVILAYILRVIPYILGYPIPITDDAIRDFGEVKYIIEYGVPNLQSHYGTFPILHLIVAFFSMVGIDALKAFLLIPQGIASLLLVFGYMFFRLHYGARISLWCISAIAVFGPHIYWSSQPVRETLGLGMMLFVMYFFARSVNASFIKKETRWKTRSSRSGRMLYFNTMLLFGSMILIMTHHWSTLMTLLFLVGYSAFNPQLRGKRVKAAIILSVLVLMTSLYWMTLFPYAFMLMLSPVLSMTRYLESGHLLLYATIVVGLFIFAIVKYFRKAPKYLLQIIDSFRRRAYILFNKNSFRSRTYLPIVISASVIISAIIAIQIFAPFRYPFHFISGPLIFCVLFIFGVYLSESRDFEWIIGIIMIYCSLAIVPLFLILMGERLHELPYDFLRVAEFMIIPAAPMIAFSLKRLKFSYRTATFIFLIIAGVFAFPTYFIFGPQYGDILPYDVRNDVRYITAQGFEIIDMANDAGIFLMTENYVIESYQTIISGMDPFGRVAYLARENDARLIANIEYVKDSKLGHGVPSDAFFGCDVLMKNEWGTVYENCSIP